MTAVGWDEDDCTGDCCRRTEPDLNRLLPPGTRARLHAAHRVDSVGAWLAGHGHPLIAEVLWRTLRMW